ncbi:MAG: helix-turn-helix transcriptional regulator [Alcaligenaceae bacterium]|nr:helix-turn-helix transcriptional regulator [Alcaligenaceae bacterium]
MTQLLTAYQVARRGQALSQAELAEKAGLSRMAVQKIESGTTDPRLSSLLVLARALGMELMLVPEALRNELDAFVRSGGRALGQSPGINAPLSIVDDLIQRTD